MSDQFPVLIDRAKQAVAQCTSIAELKQMSDKAAALKTYARRHKLSAQLRNQVTALDLRVERRMGELLAQMEKPKGGNPKLKKPTGRGPRPVESASQPTLKDLGVSKDESVRAQKLAKLPEPHFDRAMSQLEAVEQEIPKATVVKALEKLEDPEWVKLAKENERKPYPWRQESALTEIVRNVDKLRSIRFERLAAYLTQTPLGREHVREKHLDGAILFLQELSVQLKERL